MKRLKQFLILLLLGPTTSCGNVFIELADTSTDSALLHQAKMDLGTGLWTSAITDISKMSGAAQAIRTTQDLLASAYAGRCGLDAINISLKLSGMGSANFFGFVYKMGLGATAAMINDCISAESPASTTLLFSGWGTSPFF